ncbi:phage tail protein [Citrobacter freundii]|uniref:phage tail protein n=1 Tax=Citrobacter freundii TaxID=546 RepID=UPI001E334655|nr:phage tail protein [Citrobacter freundii]
MPPVQTPDNLFHDGNPLTGELGTIVDAEHLNNEQAAIRDTQSELIAILTAAAMEPESTAGQLLAALNKLYAPLNDTLGALSSLVGGANKLPYFTSANAAALTALSSIGRDIVGKATVADVLTYLGLGEGSALPVGVPVPWPSATPPTGWLKCNGAAFSAEEYPELAKAYPTNKLPDLRGEFIRGWDDGRGVDSGRALLSAQSDTLQNITGSFLDMTTGPNNNTVGAFTSSTLTPNLASIATGGAYKQANYYFDASRVARTSTETRARNIAFNFIVRAA